MLMMERLYGGIPLLFNPLICASSSNLTHMIYAVLKLREELADQLQTRQSFEDMTPKTETTEKILLITNRRIKDLEEALKVLEPVSC